MVRQEKETNTMTSSLSQQQQQQQEQQPYEELKIRDGPLYAINAPERNESSQCLLDYEAKQQQQQQQQQQHDDGQKETPATSSSSFSQEEGNDIQCDVENNQSTTSQQQQQQQQQSAEPTFFDYFTPHRPEPLPAETTALLVVDVQPEYWSNCPAVRKDFHHFPAALQRTIDICRQRRAKIIWVRADYRYSHSPWLLQFERIRGPRNLGEVPCDPNSPGFTWEDFAIPQGGEVIIAKSSWSSTSNTALIDILRVAGIETVLVCGLITSVCVNHSAFGVFEAGYRTVLVTDACADRGKARHEAALALYGDYMYELVTSQDLESEETGLVPAQPVWLMLDEKTKTVRANSFPKQQHQQYHQTMNSSLVIQARTSNRDADDDENVPSKNFSSRLPPKHSTRTMKLSEQGTTTTFIVGSGSSGGSTASTVSSTSSSCDDDRDNGDEGENGNYIKESTKSTSEGQVDVIHVL